MNNEITTWDVSSSRRDVGEFLSAVDSDPFQESPYLFHLWHANWINVGMQTYLQGWLLPQVPLFPPSFFYKPPFFCHSLFHFLSLCSFFLLSLNNLNLFCLKCHLALALPLLLFLLFSFLALWLFLFLTYFLHHLLSPFIPLYPLPHLPGPAFLP